jgi:hypothetical protein
VELVRLADGDECPLDGRDLPLADGERGQVERDGAGQGRHGREPLLPTPGRERHEIVGIRPLGVLRAGGAGVRRGGIGELVGHGLRDELDSASARRRLRLATGEGGGLLRGLCHGGTEKDYLNQAAARQRAT